MPPRSHVMVGPKVVRETQSKHSATLTKGRSHLLLFAVVSHPGTYCSWPSLREGTPGTMVSTVVFVLFI